MYELDKRVLFLEEELEKLTDVVFNISKFLNKVSENKVGYPGSIAIDEKVQRHEFIGPISKMKRYSKD